MFVSLSPNLHPWIIHLIVTLVADRNVNINI